jgi:hypothetical protein
MSFDIGEVLGEVKDFAEGALGDDTDKYTDALTKGIDAMDKAKNLLEKIQGGDKAAVQVALTEWEDVNKTLMAIGKMDEAIEKAKDGTSLNEVLDVVGKVMKVVATIGMVAL